MYCKNCGKQIDERQKFCPYCGSPNGGSTETFYEPKRDYPEKINMISAYKLMFKNYAKFKGRSRRSEYWYAELANLLIVLAVFLLIVVLGGVGVMLPTTYGDSYSDSGLIFMGISGIIWFLLVIYAIALIVPRLALMIRRLHDTGKSGWYLFLSLVPFVGGIIMLVFMATDSQPGFNQYGKNPKGF